jgi:hypothetical protein
MYGVLLAALAELPGCPSVDTETGDAGSSGAAGAAGSACRPLDGVYRFSYTLRSGNCGAQQDELLQFVNGRSMPAPTQSCQSGGESMVTACELRRDSQCTVSDAITGELLGAAHVTGVLSETSDNSSVKGRFDVRITDVTGGTCASTYDVIGTRVR